MNLQVLKYGDKRREKLLILLLVLEQEALFQELQNILKKKSKIKIWGVDSYGSVYKKYHETGKFDKNEIYPYTTEGIGEDILPKNVDFSIIDHFEKVTDKDAALFTRKLAREEGIFAGNSCGAAIKGVLQLKKHFKKGDVVVVLLHDSGSRYIGKIYNDEWMKKMNFLKK